MSKIIEVSSLSDSGVEVYSQLTENQLRNRLEPEKGIFIAESVKVIKVALDEGFEPLSMLMERKFVDGLARDVIARCSDIPVFTGDTELLSQIAGYKLTRGVFCAMRRPRPRTVADVCRDARRIAILDNVVDATNIGAIFRSAAALNFDAVLLSPTCCDPLIRRAVRVSMGTVFQIPWAYLCQKTAQPNSTDFQPVKQLGFKIVAMALNENAISIEDPRLVNEPKLAVVMGAEGDGLTQSTLTDCDYIVQIPMARGVDSLNVAAASAVTFWQLRVK